MGHDFTWHHQIVQHPNELIYAAARGGIIEFDGVKWRLIYRNTGIHYISISDSGDIYLIVHNKSL